MYVENRGFTLSFRKLLLSKWLIYGFILLLLMAIVYVLIPYLIQVGVISPALALNIYSEALGLFFTLLVFMGFLELRSWLEWKSVEKRVKNRVGRQIDAVYSHLIIFCQVEKVHAFPLPKGGRKGWVDRQLDALTSEEVRLTEEGKKDLLKEGMRQGYVKILESILNSLGRLEERYSKFLSSEVRASLMDIQAYLDELTLEFSIRHLRNEDYFQLVSNLIGKIMKEIKRLRENGFWINL